MTSTLETPAPPADTGSTSRTPVTAVTWNRVCLVALLVATAVMYLWNITINGMGNQFYAAAAQAGSTNWEALLFGSLDTHNFITVDKPPVSQWVMGLSGQIFGFSSASMLIPQALMAVAAVALLYGAVTRISGPAAGLLAGAALSLTPVAVLMFRFNNPDAVMVLLMTATAYCTVRAVQRASWQWLAWAGVALGFAFLAKMLEGLMVAPALAAAYLIAAPTTLRARLTHVGVAAVAFFISAGWFVVVTLLWPASSRPYIAGSTDNNFMNLVLGYNGFARVLGKNHMGFGSPHQVVGSAAGAQVNLGGHGGFGGFGAGQSQGWSRLFGGEFGFEIGWLVPAALVATVLVVISRGRAPRTDLTRAAAILFGGWLVVDGLVLSFMSGMIHPYYCMSVAPPVAAMFGIGVHEFWLKREKWLYRIALAALVGGTGAWGWWILGRNAGWMPALRWSILAASVVAIVALLAPWAAERRVAVGALSLGLVGALAGPTAYAIATVGQPHQGGGPTVGPPDASRKNHFGFFGQNADNPKLDELLRNTDTEYSAAILRSSSAAGLELSTNTAVMAIGGFSGSDPVPSLGEFQNDVAQHKVTYYVVANNPGRGPGWGNRGHADIAKWVMTTFPAVSVGEATVYNLSTPK